MSHPGGIYLIRTRKPTALVGLPVIGRHNGYVGRTVSYTRRKVQHLEGDPYWGHRAKDWADLDPTFYRLLPLPAWVWLQDLVETVAIWALCPVYNVEKQAPWNVRRVGLRRAALQRAARDRFGTSARVASLAIRCLIYTSVLVALAAAWRVTR